MTQPDNTTNMDFYSYHLHSCHSNQPWAKGMTEPFPCDCGLTNLIAQEANKARLEQTIHLQVAEQKFGKVDWQAAIYELGTRDKFGGLTAEKGQA